MVGYVAPKNQRFAVEVQSHSGKWLKPSGEKHGTPPTAVASHGRVSSNFGKTYNAGLSDGIVGEPRPYLAPNASKVVGTSLTECILACGLVVCFSFVKH